MIEKVDAGFGLLGSFGCKMRRQVLRVMAVDWFITSFFNFTAEYFSYRTFS